MNFVENVSKIQNQFGVNGYEKVSEQFNLRPITKGTKVTNCEIIAKKDFYNILYVEAESHWKALATDIVQKNENRCMVITLYDHKYYILSTMQEVDSSHLIPRHIVLEIDSNSHTLEKFIQTIKVGINDDVSTIYKKVHESFDKFSRYKEAITEFSDNLGDIIETTKTMIGDLIKDNKKYAKESEKILKMCREIINNSMTLDDIRDMLIQHVLTFKIFSLVYDEQKFHTTNTVAKSLEKLKTILKIRPNTVDYSTMEIIAESITDINQRQEFLKKIYETFYTKYDPEKAKKDGIVYTPTEVVNFMVKSTNKLLKKHFKKDLSDDTVKILDPATGTGTFPVHILREIRPNRLEAKYKQELFANEISILPYYIAALNIEHTYKELHGDYKEFDNICWMDTLDGGTKNYEKISTYFEDDDNIKRISRQQNSNINVIIGNPPYNVDEIKDHSELDVHIKSEWNEDHKKIHSDMYKRFLWWSKNRLKNKGMVVFISNNSFLDAKSESGLRRALYDEFDYIYIVNLKGNAHAVGEERRKQKGNVFNDKIKVGVTITFFIKTGEGNSEIQYTEIDDYMKSIDKLNWLNTQTIADLECRKIIPNEENTWINPPDNDFNKLIPLLPRAYNESIFEISTAGVSTAKDQWAYDFDISSLIKKIKFYISTYNNALNDPNEKSRIKNLKREKLTDKIKWSGKTIECLLRSIPLHFSKECIKQTLFRPFVIKHQYYDLVITHRMRNFSNIFKNSKSNLLICFTNPMSGMIFSSLASDLMVDYHCVSTSQNIPLYKYNNKNIKQSNITNYALKLFQKHYNNSKILHADIFYYVYAIINDPKYEEKYRHNLSNHFPQIPLVKNFIEYLTNGKKLFELHCKFNEVKEYELKRNEKLSKKNQTRLLLRKNKIIIDDMTTLEGIPEEVSKYKIRAKNPLEYILEFYKDSKNHILNDSGSNDEKIRETFSTYEFADHKEEIITLIKKVTTVCVETVKLQKELKSLEWGPQPDLNLTPIEKNKPKKQAKKSKKNNTKKRKTSTIILKRSRKEKIKDEVLARNNQSTFDNTMNK